MADVLFVAVILAFFGVAVLLVRACDRIIGPDAEAAGAPIHDGPGDTRSADGRVPVVAGERR